MWYKKDHDTTKNPTALTWISYLTTAAVNINLSTLSASAPAFPSHCQILSLHIFLFLSSKSTHGERLNPSPESSLSW